MDIVNPVSFVQIFSYYVDGFLFSYLFILILGLTRLLDAENREQRKITWNATGWGAGNWFNFDIF